MRDLNLMSEYDEHLSALQNLYRSALAFRSRYKKRTQTPWILLHEAQEDLCKAVAQVEKTLRTQ